MLTFDQAEEILKDAFPETFKTIRFERTTHSDNSSSTKISIYISLPIPHWTSEHQTFESAIRDAVTYATSYATYATAYIPSPSEGIHD